VASAPRRTGIDPSGAVRSSWIWNLLMDVFMFTTSETKFRRFIFETSLRLISVDPAALPYKGVTPLFDESFRPGLAAGA
jgi:hypothetical protein